MLSSRLLATSDISEEIQVVQVIWKAAKRHRTWTVHWYSPRGASVHPT